MVIWSRSKSNFPLPNEIKTMSGQQNENHDDKSNEDDNFKPSEAFVNKISGMLFKSRCIFKGLFRMVRNWMISFVQLKLLRAIYVF